MRLGANARSLRALGVPIVDLSVGVVGIREAQARGVSITEGVIRLVFVPTTVVTIWVFWKLMSALTHLSGLTLEEALHSPPPKKDKP